MREIFEMERVHCKSGKPYDIYIGRPSPLGNPFSHLPHTLALYRAATREGAVEAYRVWIRQQKHLTKQVKALYGLTLGCWCRPDQACHGDVLIEYCEELNATNP